MDGILSKNAAGRMVFSQYYKFLLDQDFAMNVPNSSFFE